MEVVTIRVQENIAKGVAQLAKEMNKSRAEVIRELMNKAVQEEQLQLLLKKYENKEMTLRTLAKKLGLPLWKAHDLLAKIAFPYGKGDLQRDLRLIEGL